MLNCIKELFQIKRMNDILDLIKIQKDLRERTDMEFLKLSDKTTVKDLPTLFQPQLAYGYEKDLRPFVRRLMASNKTNEEIVRIVMKDLDDQVKLRIDLLKMVLNHK